MIQRKVCMMGAFAVGKTSLVRRFVHSTFGEKYFSTVGVSIDRKETPVGDAVHTLILWDIAGRDGTGRQTPASYLRGAAGYVLVADGTRRETLREARAVRAVSPALDDLPFVLMVNKSDLRDGWEIEPADLELWSAEGADVVLTSAKTGAGVEEAFARLARRMAREA